MSYGPPSPTPPTPNPTSTCCEPNKLKSVIAEKFYNKDISVFDDSPQQEAIDWLKEDACNCGTCKQDQWVQRYALAVLYFSTQGNNWNSCSAPQNIESNDECKVKSVYGKENGYKWLTCNTECDWAGTGCNNGNNLNAIDIEDNKLSGNIPPEIGFLLDLKFLALEVNDIAGSIPEELNALTKLQVLDLDYNKLTGSLIDLSSFTKLKQLDLNRNELKGDITNLGWEKLTDLTFLDLSQNKFTGLIPIKIGDLFPKLSKL